MTDTDALQSYVADGNRDALALMITQYQPLVYGVCLRTLGDEADARDAMQDTFVKLMRSAGEVRGSLPGWLHRSATTTSLDLIRGSARRRKYERGAEQDSASSHTQSSSQASCDGTDTSGGGGGGVSGGGGGRAAWREARRALDETLDELPDEVRSLLVQHYLFDQPQAVLARQQNVSASMMSRRIRAALEQLRRRLEAKGFAVGAAALAAGLAAEAQAAAAVAATTGSTAAVMQSIAPTPMGGTSATASGTATPAAATNFATGPATGAATATSAPSLTPAPVGWLWLGTKIKLSTAILGSLAIHAALVAGYLLATAEDPSTPAGLSPTRQIQAAPLESAPAALPASGTSSPAPTASPLPPSPRGEQHILPRGGSPGVAAPRIDPRLEPPPRRQPPRRQPPRRQPPPRHPRPPPTPRMPAIPPRRNSNPCPRRCSASGWVQSWKTASRRMASRSRSRRSGSR